MTATSMSCRRTLAATTPYLDGQLSAERRATVQAHLRECSSCLAEFRVTLELARIARTLPRRASAQDLPGRVRTEVARRRAVHAGSLADRQVGKRLRHAISLVAVALVAFAGGCVFWALVSGSRTAADVQPGQVGEVLPSSATGEIDESPDVPPSRRLRPIRVPEPEVDAAVDPGRDRRYR